MKFGKSIVFALGSLTSIAFASYDVEMFTFYPYHCESTLMKQIKKVFGSEIFVETGTLGGETAFAAASIFDKVYSVELSNDLFKNAQERNIYSNVSLYHDSSDHFLDNFLPNVQSKKKLFWLDAHYSGGNTATLIDERTGSPKAPIWGELTAIFKNNLRDSVILIDDISGYLLDPAADMRYPHLHHQYALIKKICPTAELYVVGDLALVYDSLYHIPTVSPIVQSCTVSRMFDWYASCFEDEKTVLEAEYGLIQRCYEDEADRIRYLSGYCSCRDYRLWRGLVNLGRGDFTQAAKDFHYVIEEGMNHWRISFYLAYALAKSQEYDQAQVILKNIDSHLKEHEAFFNNAYPL